MSLIVEMAYPEKFSFEKLKEQRSFAAKKNYIETHLQKIGTGSSRIVYAVDDDKVLKFAKNKKGLAQNEVEYDYYLEDIEIFAKVFEYDENFYWIEMETARKASISDIKKMYGITFVDICNFILDKFSEYSWGEDKRTASIQRKIIGGSKPIGKRLYDAYLEWVNGEEISNDYQIDKRLGYLLEDISNFFMWYTPDITQLVDLFRLANWGFVKRNGEETLVIVDYGYNEKVQREHYKKHR